MATDLAIPSSRAAAVALNSQTLYVLEQAGEIAREILDGRIVDWTEQGWTQTRIAEEVGCSQQAVSKRQARLGLQPSQPQDHSQRYNAVVPPENGSGPDVADDEVEEVWGEEVVLPAPSAHQGPVKAAPRVVSGVRFPGGGISDKADVAEYNTADLKRVAENLLRRATAKEAAALHVLFTKFAVEAERQSVTE